MPKSSTSCKMANEVPSYRKYSIFMHSDWLNENGKKFADWSKTKFSVVVYDKMSSEKRRGDRKEVAACMRKDEKVEVEGLNTTCGG